MLGQRRRRWANIIQTLGYPLQPGDRIWTSESDVSKYFIALNFEVDLLCLDSISLYQDCMMMYQSITRSESWCILFISHANSFYYVFLFACAGLYTFSINFRKVCVRFRWPFRCQPRHIGHSSLFYLFLGSFLVVIIPWIWTNWVFTYICAPQRDISIGLAAAETLWSAKFGIV